MSVTLEMGHINSGEYDGIDNIKFKSIVVEKLESINKGTKTTNYIKVESLLVKDIGWANSIITMEIKSPNLMIYLLNYLKLSYIPTNDGLSPLARNSDWVNISINGKNWERLMEVHNGLDHVGIFRFIDPDNDNEFAKKI